jgi:hypothetical protein
LWLFLSYGYALYYAANLIGEGSELLLLVPSMAGLVGGVVLPLLGAVPDGGKDEKPITSIRDSTSTQVTHFQHFSLLYFISYHLV